MTRPVAAGGLCERGRRPGPGSCEDGPRRWRERCHWVAVLSPKRPPTCPADRRERSKLPLLGRPIDRRAGARMLVPALALALGAGVPAPRGRR